MRATRHLVALALGLSLGGCLVDHAPVASHCSNARGDADCVEKYGTSRSFCARGPCSPAVDGCVATRPEDDACYSPCGAGTSLAANPSCTGADDDTTAAGTSSATSASDSDTTTSTPCLDASDCEDPTTPICDDMRCSPCTTAILPDDACELRSPDAPVCRDDGACVACTPANAAACVDTTPICSADTNTCEPCSFHADCPGSACEIATGECFAKTCVVHVDADGDADFLTVQEALTGLADDCVIVVHETDGGYPENLTMDTPDELSIALIAADGEAPSINGFGDSDGPLLAVSDGPIVYIEGLRFAGNVLGEVGVAADSVKLYLDRVHIVANQGGGMTIANGSLVRLRNCFIGGNGLGTTTSPGVRVTASTLYITYTTVAGNDAAMEDSLVCNVASAVTARNSIFLGHDYYSVDCGPLTATHSMFDEVIVGDGNDAVSAIEDNWFVDASAGDLHLTAEGILRFLNIARWDAGDPPIDIDGNPRPNEPGTSDLPGADRP